MADEIPFFAPGAQPTIAPRSPKPGEEVWRLKNEQGRIAACELRDDSRAGLGWDVQLLQDGELLWSKRCPTQDMARWTANCFRQDYMRTWIHRAARASRDNLVEPKRHDSSEG